MNWITESFYPISIPSRKLVVSCENEERKLGWNISILNLCCCNQILCPISTLEYVYHEEFRRIEFDLKIDMLNE